MADALLLLSAIDHIRQHEKAEMKIFEEEEGIFFFPTSYFVSSNSGDFSDPNDKAVIHPDLKPILERSETKFYHNLNPLITSLDEELTLQEEAAIEDADNWIHCDICDYEFSRIEFNSSFDIFDPHILHQDSNDPAQVTLFEGMEVEPIDPTVKMRTAQCDHCGTDFLECPNCMELVQVDGYNTVIECTGCDYKFILHAETDRKGVVYEMDYEIIQEFKCDYCGEKADSLNEEGLCEDCVNYKKIAEED